MRQLISANGMAGENRPLNSEAVENCVNIGGKRGLIIWSIRMRRLAESAASYRDDSMVSGKSLSEVVEHMRVVSNTRQKYDRQSAAAKIEDMKPHVWRNLNSNSTMRCGVCPSIVGNVACRNGCHVSEPGPRYARRRRASGSASDNRRKDEDAGRFHGTNVGRFAERVPGRESASRFSPENHLRPLST